MQLRHCERRGDDAQVLSNKSLPMQCGWSIREAREMGLRSTRESTNLTCSCATVSAVGDDTEVLSPQNVLQCSGRQWERDDGLRILSAHDFQVLPSHLQLRHCQRSGNDAEVLSPLDGLGPRGAGQDLPGGQGGR
jgi:hypothetical protein